MKVYRHEDAFTHLNYILKNQIEDFFIAIIDDTVVHYGEDGGFDETKTTELGIKCYNLKKKGGAMVTSPGDVVYCFTTKRECAHFDTELRKFLATKLIERNIKTEQINNDLLANGKKCSGTMHQQIGKLHFYGGHISIGCNLDLIKEICTKEMVKIPCGLSDYGITTENVVRWLQEFWFYWK